MWCRVDDLRTRSVERLMTVKVVISGNCTHMRQMPPLASGVQLLRRSGPHQNIDQKKVSPKPTAIYTAPTNTTPPKMRGSLVRTRTNMDINVAFVKDKQVTVEIHDM